MFDLDKARDEAPFSNSDEGFAWMGAHCETCVHDKAARAGREEDGCPLLALAFANLTPAEWIPGEHTRPENRWLCVMYRHEDDGGDPEPKPIPDPPGQLTLFPRDGFEGVRMLKLCTTAGVTAPADCDHEFAKAPSGEPTVCRCGYTYVEYDRAMGERIAEGLEFQRAWGAR